jgi:hypothetical protein
MYMARASAADGIAPADLLITDRLRTRLARTSDVRGELNAFREVSSAACRDPDRAVQRFLDMAVGLCPSAGSAGLCELQVEDGETIFRWTHLAGEFAPYVGGVTPRHVSPCGLCLDRGHTILVSRPARVFPYFNDAHVPIVEALIVPLGPAEDPIGTVWVASHREVVRGFDRTDAQIMEHLADLLQLTLRLQRLQRAAALAPLTPAAQGPHA